MRVGIAGGHGKVVRRLTQLLHNRGDHTLSLDLESASEEHIAAALGSSTDAVVLAAGAGPGSEPERKWTVDYGAAVKLIAAAEATGTDRYVMLSSIGAADAELMGSGLEYTIVRPTLMSDDPGTGRVHIVDHVDEDARVSRDDLAAVLAAALHHRRTGEDARVSRDDVAAVLAATLHHRETVQRILEVGPGDVPIDEAVATVALTD